MSDRAGKLRVLTSSIARAVCITASPSKAIAIGAVLERHVLDYWDVVSGLIRQVYPLESDFAFHNDEIRGVVQEALAGSYKAGSTENALLAIWPLPIANSPVDLAAEPDLKAQYIDARKLRRRLQQTASHIAIRLRKRVYPPVSRDLAAPVPPLHHWLDDPHLSPPLHLACYVPWPSFFSEGCRGRRLQHWPSVPQIASAA